MLPHVAKRPCPPREPEGITAEVIGASASVRVETGRRTADEWLSTMFRCGRRAWSVWANEKDQALEEKERAFLESAFDSVFSDGKLNVGSWQALIKAVPPTSIPSGMALVALLCNINRRVINTIHGDYDSSLYQATETIGFFMHALKMQAATAGEWRRFLRSVTAVISEVVFSGKRQFSGGCDPLRDATVQAREQFEAQARTSRDVMFGILYITAAVLHISYGRKMHVFVHEIAHVYVQLAATAEAVGDSIVFVDTPTPIDGRDRHPVDMILLWHRAPDGFDFHGISMTCAVVFLEDLDTEQQQHSAEMVEQAHQDALEVKRMQARVHNNVSQ